jgi:hypothetical protein
MPIVLLRSRLESLQAVRRVGGLLSNPFLSLVGSGERTYNTVERGNLPLHSPAELSSDLSGQGSYLGRGGQAKELDDKLTMLKAMYIDYLQLCVCVWV